MGTEEEKAQGENVDEEVEDLEATEADDVAGGRGLTEVSGLKFEQDVIEMKSNTRG